MMGHLGTAVERTCFATVCVEKQVFAEVWRNYECYNATVQIRFDPVIFHASSKRIISPIAWNRWIRTKITRFRLFWSATDKEAPLRTD